MHLHPVAYVVVMVRSSKKALSWGCPIPESERRPLDFGPTAFMNTLKAKVSRITVQPAVVSFSSQYQLDVMLPDVTFTNKSVFQKG